MLYGFMWLRQFIVMKQVLILEADKLMRYGLALSGRLFTFTRVVLFPETPFVLRLVMPLPFAFGKIPGYATILFILDITYYITWKKTKIALFNNALQMILGFGIGVDRLMREEQKLNSTPCISDITILENEELVDSDTCIWSLSHYDKFLVNSVRKHIDELSLPSLSPSTRWCKISPRKVNIFIWRMFLDMLPNRLNLSSRGLDIDSIMCPVCHVSIESSAHTFFSCDTASAVWHLVLVWSGSMFSSFSSWRVRSLVSVMAHLKGK
ncbi:RNA-directed DNA polymerase, eukaryota, reverse transcriptase zinc-binding domain protein [Tanacetum coccineum]